VLAPSETAANDLAELILEDEHLDLAGASALAEFRSALLKASCADVVLAGGVSSPKLPKIDVPLVLLLDDGADLWVGDSNVKAALPAHTTSTEVAAALIAAAAGFTVLTAAQTEAMLNAVPIPAIEPELFVEHLTPRELEVLRLMGSGSANKEIAEELHISENTVKFHVASILGKLNSGSRTEAVARGLRTGLIPV
jgi:DNA-binding CsgD family transcriptional regulator